MGGLGRSAQYNRHTVAFEHPEIFMGDRQTYRLGQMFGEHGDPRSTGRKPHRRLGLQFCRAVHMEQTLRFPSKRQQKRLSEA
jgi:ribosomal protein L44E